MQLNNSCPDIVPGKLCQASVVEWRVARVTLEGQSYNRHETGHSEWRPIPFEEWRFHAASSDTPAHALALFDFSQRLVDIWHRSNSQDKRQIVDCVSLNRTLSDVTLVLAKRSPFDYLAERPFLKDGRGEGI